LEHYDTLGMVAAGISLICIFMVYRVSKLAQQPTPQVPKNQPEQASSLKV
jgi:hypothetical protein